MPCKAVIFDLDGTLLNTLEDIVNTLNSVLHQHNYPQHSVDACRFLVGHGMRELVKKALPEEAGTPEIIDSMLEDLLLHYADNWNVHSRPYEGIAEMLDELTARGVKKAILSNKADNFTRLCAEQLLSEWHFDMVMGHTD
ncbi:MAG: HAD hydrolase-like protein, partial [Chlorobiaceae bacterium]|nr:HAD hydrolase-like protein [Chlorobiaceae bacterium]